MSKLFEIRVKEDFEAAHYLWQYLGKKEVCHGHSWMVEVFIRSKTLDHEGLAFDFHKALEILHSIVGKYHNHTINEFHPFDKMNPSAENIADWVMECFQNKCTPDLSVYKVTVWEGRENYASVINSL